VLSGKERAEDREGKGLERIEIKQRKEINMAILKKLTR
jgi:hypothetical protein